MSSSRFGYPNIKVGKLTNEQNLQNAKGFMYSMSDEVSRYIEQLENKVEQLQAEVTELGRNK